MEAREAGAIRMRNGLRFRIWALGFEFRYCEAARLGAVEGLLGFSGWFGFETD